MGLLREVRTAALDAARSASRAALARAPAPLQDAVSRVRDRYDAGRIDARRALEDLAALEEQAFQVAVKLVMFPWATAGAIRELYGRIRELEKDAESREARIRALEQKIRELESR